MSVLSISEKEAEEWLLSFPRLFDLYRHSDKDDPKNYFNFKELFPIAFLGVQSYAQIESFLQRLNLKAWEKLRDKALQYITVDHPTRRYEQLFSALDEARGYALLADQGYEPIEFIEPKPSNKSGPQWPDLFATKGGSTATLEVKTINESDACLAPDAAWRHEAIRVRSNLSEEFKRKVVSTIGRAQDQLNNYPRASDRKTVLLVVRFDYGQKTGGHLYLELENFIALQTMKDGIEIRYQSAL